MSRYAILADHLNRQGGDSWIATFRDIEMILGFNLPDSAYRHPAWRANQSGQGHAQVRSWRDAGWKTRELDLAGHAVKFERTTKSRIPIADNDDSIARARSLTGIADRNALIA